MFFVLKREIEKKYFYFIGSAQSNFVHIKISYRIVTNHIFYKLKAWLEISTEKAEYFFEPSNLLT